MPLTNAAHTPAPGWSPTGRQLAYGGAVVAGLAAAGYGAKKWLAHRRAAQPSPNENPP